jgi:hypothetical protein
MIRRANFDRQKGSLERTRKKENEVTTDRHGLTRINTEDRESREQKSEGSPRLRAQANAILLAEYPIILPV